MPTSDRTLDRATRRARRFLVALGDEIRRARAERGISQAALGAMIGIGQSQVARIEAGAVESLSLIVAARVLAPIGRDLSVNVYRGGAPLRDAGQLRLLETIRARIPSALRWRTEVPIDLPGDQRAWDAVVDGARVNVAWECVTRLEDWQSIERTINLKQRDSLILCVVLVLADSRHNRGVVRAAPGLRRSFPLGARAIFAALGRGEQPRGKGLVFV
jgi:transcriptional regulator with XRE-family HTH domain